MCFWVTFVQESREIENNTGEEQGQTKQEGGDQEDQVSPENESLIIFFQDFQDFDNDMGHQAPPIPRK